MTTHLSEHEGRDVLQATVRLVRAGDGLSAAMTVDPAEYHIGQTVYLLMEAEVTAITYKPIPDVDALARIHTLTAGTATVVDEKFAKRKLDEQRIAIERSQGVERLPGTTPDDD